MGGLAWRHAVAHISTSAPESPKQSTSTWSTWSATVAGTPAIRPTALGVSDADAWVSGSVDVPLFRLREVGSQVAQAVQSLGISFVRPWWLQVGQG